MSLDSEPCSCGGDNPNCFRCWGTGMYRGKSFKGSSRGKSSAGSSQGAYLGSVASGASLTQCRECGAYVSGLLEHLQQAHGPAASKKEDQSAGGKTTRGKTLWLTPRQARSGTPKKRPGILMSPEVKCPKCTASFPNITQLGSHVIGSHGLRAFYALDLQAPRSQVQPGAKKKRAKAKKNRSEPGRVPPPVERGSASPDSAAQEQRLDAKLYWGHSFRDHGQFGSYPSHDDMDDES